jgi:hypothetical protein
MSTVTEPSRGKVSDVFGRLRVHIDLTSVDRTALPLAFQARILNYTNQLQEQTNWCWAAVSNAVDHYYDSTSSSTQCSIANGTLGRSDCCGVGASGACNIPYFLNQALSNVGHLDFFTSSSYSFSKVTSEIDTGRPLCIRVGWSGGGGHFLAIHGYFNFFFFTERLTLADPIYGVQTVNYTGLFNDSYQGSGTWTHTYETD